MTDDRLLELAAMVADGRAVDWDVVRRDHPELKDEIDNLERIEHLGARFSGFGLGDGEAGPDSPGVGQAWGHLRLTERLAGGSFGEVWCAFDPVLQRDVALKLRRDDIDSRTSAREFISEARRLAKVRHPNILGVHGADIHDGRVGLWAELLAGRTLEQEIEAGERFTADRVVEIGRDMARALGAVHAAGLVHGDVKAANVAIEPDGRAVLMDFGAGVDLASTEHENLSYGSPLSAAPERLEGAPLAASADVWSLGVLLFRLAEGGGYPFEAGDIEGLRELHRSRAADRTPPPAIPASRALRRLVERMLDPDPECRPTAAEVADRLRWIAHAPLRRRRRLAAAAIIGSLLLGTIAATVGFVRARNQARAAEVARRDAEDVNTFLGEILGAPRLAHGGRNVLVTEVLESAARRVRSTLPEGSSARARILRILGATYAALERLDQAEPLQREAVAELAAVYGPADPRTVRAEVQLADTLRRLGEVDESRRLFADAQARARTLPEDDEVQAWLRLNQAVAALDDGDLDRAESLLEEARSMRHGSRWYGDVARQSVDVNLSVVWLEQGRYAETVDLLEPLAEELEATRGMRNGNTLLAFNNLATALNALNRREEALDRLTEVAEVAEAWLGADHRYAFAARLNAAVSAKELGDVERAAEDERRLIDRARRIFGPDHPATLQAESNLAVSLKELGDTAEASRMMDDVAARAVAALGSDHPLSYIVAVNRAEIRLEAGAPQKALEILGPTRDRMASRLGAGHLFVLAADSVLGAAHCALGDTDTGLAILRSTLEAQRALGGDDDQQALLTQIRLGEALAGAGDSEAGRDVLEDVVDRCRASLADQHPLAVAARKALADVAAASDGGATARSAPSPIIGRFDPHRAQSAVTDQSQVPPVSKSSVKMGSAA